MYWQKETSRLRIVETDENIEIIVPPPRFQSHMTYVCIVCNFILLFPILAIAYAIYYADLIYKIISAIFSLPWVGFGVMINIILIKLFVGKTSIVVDSEKIAIYRSSKASVFQLEKIIGFKFSKSNDKPENLYPKFYILTTEEEYSLDCVFTNGDVVLLADKIGNRLQVEVLEEIPS